MIYFTADTHFFHQELLGHNDFAPRLFQTTSEMNETIVTNWNARISDKDLVYHLGDIAIHPSNQKGHQEVLDLLLRLNGHITFIKGNHDNRDLFKFLAKNNPLLSDGKTKFSFEDVGIIIKFNHQQFFLTHYPLILGKTKNSYNLHGHIHNHYVPYPENINVGIDSPEVRLLTPNLDFGTPLSESDIEMIILIKKETYQKAR